VEVDAYFKPTPHYHLYSALQQAKEAEQKCASEATRLAKEVEMAQHARKWLANLEENTKMPLSLEERDWQHACGGRNLVAPAWITVTQTQVEALVRARDLHPHPVALFPEAALQKRQHKLKLKIMSASGLGSDTLGYQPNTYCTCEVPMKPDSRLQTAVVAGTSDPEWRYSRSVKGYMPGDALVMEVYGVFDDGSQQPGTRSKVDELLGRAFLPGEKFYPNGYDGLLNLTLGTRQTGAKLRVTALVIDEA